ncbi:MAG TPA: polyphosphate kinase 1 [Bryobacteraceae bacterium]|nr:polyphosphate kinase 1 [Bryobacteraceae bacterium]
MPKKTGTAAVARGVAKQAAGRAATRNGAAAASAIDLRDPSLYVNRELSLLSFQRRVLEEAEDKSNPLLERVKFISIVGSNLDEFFMVRVAGLNAQLDAGILEVGPDGMSPRAQLIAIRRETKRLLADMHKCLGQIRPELEAQGIRMVDYAGLTGPQQKVAAQYFEQTVFPVLTPLAFDPGRPFPHISNLSLNLAVVIRDREGEEHFARIKVPDSLPQLVPVSQSPNPKNRHKSAPRKIEMVWLEQVIAAHLHKLFPGMQVAEAHAFHITRDADMAIKELEAEDLLETIEEGVRARRFGSVVRLMVSEDMPAHILNILINNLEVDASEVYKTAAPLSLKRLMDLYNIDRPDLKDTPFVPALPLALAPTGDEEDVFAVVRHQDILLHHPFDSFQPVIDLLDKAAHDSRVLAIKSCLYRVGRNSPVVEALLEAAREDKQVAVLVELKARFDEESNIEWARALESEGVHVVYGLVGLKIHSKVTMIVRREGDRIVRYVHLSTGNYNAVTAHLYTDIGLFTANDQIADDVTNLFNYLTGYSAKSDYQKLLVAPVNLRSRMLALIEREIEHKKRGRNGQLIFKMNALVDPQVIRALYRASQAGVKVQLLVRGICGLRPGIAGVSENIEVSSIVGRFLEHSRIYYFANGGDEELFIGSADLMPRNIDHRVEVLFPIEDPKLIRTVKANVLSVYFSDTVKMRRMLADGSYARRKSDGAKKGFNSQEQLIRLSRYENEETRRIRSKPRP